MEIKEGVQLFFTVITGIATTGTFLFMLFDRTPKCEIQIKAGFDKVDEIEVPKLVVTIINTGRSDFFIARTWILSNEDKIAYLVHLSSNDFLNGFLLSTKRRVVKDVYLEKVLEQIDPKDLKQPELQLWVEVRTEVGKVFHSKKLSISPEQIEQALKGKARR